MSIIEAALNHIDKYQSFETPFSSDFIETILISYEEVNELEYQ